MESSKTTTEAGAITDGSYVGVEARTFNLSLGCLGAPGTGKSTYAVARLLEYARTLPAYAFAHDVGWKLPDRLPDGRETGIRRHRTVAEAASAMASDPRGIHSVSVIDAGEVIGYATRVADASLRSNQGRGGVPAVVLIDEVVSAADANPYRLGESLRSSLALRRHHNVGLIWTAQSPRLCHFQLLGLGTELVVFRLEHKRDLDAVAEAGLSPAEIDLIRKLPDHHYIIHKTR